MPFRAADASGREQAVLPASSRTDARKYETMTFDAAESVTHKIWDRSSVHHTLDALVEDLSVRHNTAKANIAVSYSGPNTFTLSVIPS